MNTTKRTAWFVGRTKLVTIASAVAVAAAGAFAIGANVGILNAADDTNLGELSATGAVAPPSSQVVDVYLDDTTAAGTAAGVPTGAGSSQTGPVPQQFTVDAAGSVALVSTDSGLRLDSVAPTSGWTWTLAQSQPSALSVTFTNGTRTLEFVATTSPDGTIAASVNEPIVTPAPPATSTASNSGHDDGHEYEGGEDDD